MRIRRAGPIATGVGEPWRPEMPAASNVNNYRQWRSDACSRSPFRRRIELRGKNYNPNNREANQDQRVANGLRSGQMTSGEAARADRTQSGIDSRSTTIARPMAAS